MVASLSTRAVHWPRARQLRPPWAAKWVHLEDVLFTNNALSAGKCWNDLQDNVKQNRRLRLSRRNQVDSPWTSHGPPQGGLPQLGSSVASSFGFSFGPHCPPLCWGMLGLNRATFPIARPAEFAEDGVSVTALSRHGRQDLVSITQAGCERNTRTRLA